MASVSDLVRLVDIHVDGCAVPAIMEQLRWAIREFCRCSRFFRDTVEIQTEAGESYYDLVSSIQQSRVIDIDAVEVDGRPLDPTGPKEAPSAAATGEDDAGSVIVSGYWMDPPNSLVLWPTPTAVSNCSASVILDMEPTASALPEALYRKWADAISYGALFRLLTIPKKPWTDMPLGKDYEARFRQQIEEAKSQASRSHRRRSFRVKSHN